MIQTPLCLIFQEPTLLEYKGQSTGALLCCFNLYHGPLSNARIQAFAYLKYASSKYIYVCWPSMAFLWALDFSMVLKLCRCTKFLEGTHTSVIRVGLGGAEKLHTRASKSHLPFGPASNFINWNVSACDRVGQVKHYRRGILTCMSRSGSGLCRDRGWWVLENSVSKTIPSRMLSNTKEVLVE